MNIVDKYNLLEVNNLSVEIKLKNEIISPIKNISFLIRNNTSNAIIGESGSGKSILASTLINLLPINSGITDGSIHFKGKNITNKDTNIRGKEISIVYQNPKASLNPVRKIIHQIAEIIRLHQKTNNKESIKRAKLLLDSLGIKNVDKRSYEYPHQFSGGMAQRAAIAMALSCKPSLLIADEPTSGLDPLLQDQVVNLLVEKTKEYKSALLMISHDINLVKNTCENVIVMYQGQIIEQGLTSNILTNPKENYTKRLIESSLLK